MQVNSASLGTSFTALEVLDVPLPPRAGGVISVGSTKGVQYGSFVAALAQSTEDPTGTVTSIARAAALAAEFRAGQHEFTISFAAVESAAAKLPGVATSFYGAGFNSGIVDLASVLRPDANGDGTPTVTPTDRGCWVVVEGGKRSSHSLPNFTDEVNVLHRKMFPVCGP